MTTNQTFFMYTPFLFLKCLYNEIICVIYLGKIQIGQMTMTMNNSKRSNILILCGLKCPYFIKYRFCRDEVCVRGVRQNSETCDRLQRSAAEQTMDYWIKQ